MHSPRLADLFEDFCRPPSSYPSNAPGNAANQASAANPQADSTSTAVPGSFLPYEDIFIPPHLQPLNPEDEDDVVPDQHAAFGITRAMGGERREGWRDLGLEALVRGGPKLGSGSGNAAGREGKKGILSIR